MSECIVIIPTYNEKENIERMVRKVMSLTEPFHVLIVDDGSPDGTARIVKDLKTEYSGRLHLLEREGKQGLGTAYITGFKWGIEHGYNYFFEMDADFSHNPEDLVRLLNACRTGGADVAVGSRYVRGGEVRNWPFDRKFLSGGASLYVRMITGMPVKDQTAGFICYKKEVLETLDLDGIEFIGYAFQIEMKFKAFNAGFRLAEVPITFVDREEGVSKMSSGIISEAIFGVIRLKWDSLFKR